MNLYMANTDQESVANHARPAEPVLASLLVSDEELDGLLGARQRMDVVGTGIKSLDDALDDGLEGGRVIAVSGEGSDVSASCQKMFVHLC
jgi:RecA/RadA recombinase